ncbi:queuosine-tRNA galactosyltransferase isoform 4-T5 [Hipposideros larvatus]
MPAQVSVILPVHDAEPWLDECLRSVLQQDFQGSMELSVFNDASRDKSMTIIEKWKVKLEGSGIPVVVGGHSWPSPRGVGYSKNQAIAQSSGSYLCFLDSDDVMMPQRVRLQHEAAVRHPTSIIGCQVRREPPNSTERYTRWINQLASDQLMTQVFTSHGPTVVMPTWFCSRAWFSHVGPFDEGGRGVPEDLLFFYDHLRRGGGVVRVDQSLLLYRFRPDAATHAVLEVSKYMKQKLTEIKGEIEKSTMTVDDLNTPISVIDRRNRWEICKDAEDTNSCINLLDLVDVYGTLHLDAEYAFF